MERQARWTFAGFEIDPTAGVLRKNGNPVRIGGQAFRALALLVSRGGELATREELQKAIWGDRVHVDFEHGLNVCIRQVRSAIGDDADGNPIIVTCPREGYRLAVSVKLAADPRARYLRHWGAAAAVVTLVGACYLFLPSFMGGVIPSLNSSTATPREAAAPNAERRPDTSLSTENAASLNATGPNALSFSPPWPTASSEAYAWYWRGRDYYERATRRKPTRALWYFERAAALDPSFALAQAGLALSHLSEAAAGIAPAQSAIKAREAAQRALELGPGYAEAHVAMAELNYRLDGDDRSAEEEFARAIELDDRNAFARQRYAFFLVQQRRFDDALEQLRAAENADPLSVFTSWHMAQVLFLAHRYEESLAQANRALDLDPTHSWSFRTVGESLEALGKREEAIDAYRNAGQVALGHLGRVYALVGRRYEARALLADLTRGPVEETGHDGVAIALIHAGLGEPAKAIEWLEKTQRDGIRLPSSLLVAPQWDSLRTSPAFSGFLDRRNLGGSEILKTAKEAEHVAGTDAVQTPRGKVQPLHPAS